MSRKRKSASLEIADILNAGSSLSPEEAEKRINAVAKRIKKEAHQKTNKMMRRLEKEIRDNLKK